MLTFAAPIVIAMSSILAQTPPAAPATGSAAPAVSAPAPVAAPKVQTVGADVPGTTAASTAVPAAPIGGAAQSQPQSSPGAFGLMLPLLMLGFVVFIFWTSSRAQKKERAKREEMIGQLRNNDKVQTTSGIIGRVVEIGDDEIVLRVDESTNTKIRFAKSAIAGVLNKSGNASSESEAKPNGAKAGV